MSQKVYIDKERVLEIVYRFCSESKPGTDPRELTREIESCPGEDVAPVVHGKWVYNDEDDFIPYCDQCRMPSDTEVPFCAICGADMRQSNYRTEEEKEDGRETDQIA